MNRDIFLTRAAYAVHGDAQMNAKETAPVRRVVDLCVDAESAGYRRGLERAAALAEYRSDNEWIPASGTSALREFARILRALDRS